MCIRGCPESPLRGRRPPPAPTPPPPAASLRPLMSADMVSPPFYTTAGGCRAKWLVVHYFPTSPAVTSTSLHTGGGMSKQWRAHFYVVVFFWGGRRRVREREALSARVVLVSPRALCLEVQHSTKKKFFRKSSTVHVSPKSRSFKKGLSFLRKVLVV